MIVRKPSSKVNEMKMTGLKLIFFERVELKHKKAQDRIDSQSIEVRIPENQQKHRYAN